MQVEQFLELSAEKFPDKTALIYGAQRLTYAEVESQCNRLAQGLIAAAVQRHDRVAVLMDNSIETAVAVFAILKAGAVFLLVNPTTKADKLSYVLNNCRAKALIVADTKLGGMRDCWGNTPHLKTLVVSGAGAFPETTAKKFYRFEEFLCSDEVSVGI